MNLAHPRRYEILAVAFAVVSVVIVIQLVRLQFSPEADSFRAIAKQYERELHVYSPPRGQIYDRWGHMLAGNQIVYEVGVELTLVQNPETIAFALSRALMAHPEYATQDYYNAVYAIASMEPVTRTYWAVADYVTQAEVDTLKKWAEEYKVLYAGYRKEDNPPSLRGLVYRPHLMRSYPENELAANIIGFVNRDGQGYGVEMKFNDLLAGESQAIWILRDPNKAEKMPRVERGVDLILTIDREIQASLEQILDQAIAANGAEGGVILVLDPKTGEILGMATTPRLNLNEFYRFAEVFPPGTPYNPAVSEDYEPGSSFKVLTMAAALDSGVVTPATQFYDNGVFEIGGIVIHNWNWGAWGPQTMQGCMQHSLNVCLAWIAHQMGESRFYSYMQAFGIGHLTGVDIADEVPGRLKIPGDEDWYESDLGTNAFGQGVAVTPLQLVSAISAIANDGKIMAPHVLRSYVDNGFQYNVSPQVVRSPVSAKTARVLTEMLAASLEEEASDALVEGYRVAGKTGTAEIPTPLGYTLNETNASFVGWGPVDNPRFVVYVWLKKPTSSPWGSVVAAPVFRQVVERLVVLMNIPPDPVRQAFFNGQ